MKIQITRPTRVDGKTCAIGDIVDTDRKTADYLTAIGKARAPEKAPAKADSKKAD